VHLRPFLRGERPAVGVFVLPVDRRRQPAVVHGLGDRRADPGLRLALGVVERPPLRPAVDLAFVEHEPAIVTDQFPLVGVGDDLFGVTLRADDRFLVGFLGLLLPLALTTRAFHYKVCGEGRI